jgi:hypothetical protein
MARRYQVGWRSSSRWVVCGALVAAFAGCGRHAVRPSEKEHLADRTMRFGANRHETASDDHVNANREGATGGNGTGGGGCGCN